MSRTSLAHKWLSIISALLLIALVCPMAPLTVRAEEGTPPPDAEPTTTPETAGNDTTTQQLRDMVIYLPIVRRDEPEITISVPTSSNIPNPSVLQQRPASGEELAPDGTITQVFDRPMDRKSVESAFQLFYLAEAQQPEPLPTSAASGATSTPSPPTEPDPDLPIGVPEDGSADGDQPMLTSDPIEVEGEFEWADDHTLLFQPDAPLQRDASYEVRIGNDAKAADGAPIADEYSVRITTAGYLEVGQVVPADGTRDVAPNAAITVMFNRPIVPLTMVEQQQNLPQPLTFEPNVAGNGEWLNTSIYMFQPDEPLQDDTTYTVTVDEGLQDVQGNPMQGSYSWSFRTALPPEVQVVSMVPRDGDDLVPIESVVEISFDQPVQPASARNSFRLRQASGNTINGTLNVINNTLLFTPSQRLEFDQSYVAEIDAGLQSAVGGRPLPEAHSSTFRTVPLPRIVRTEPSDGTTTAPPYTGFAIFFNAPIDPDTVMPEIQMTPPLSPTQVYTSYSYYDNSFYINFGALPSTDYTVRIGPNIADPYGNTTGQSLEVNFRTDKLDPFVAFAMSGGAIYDAHKPTRVYLRSANTAQVSLSLYRITPEDLLTHSWYSRDIPNSATLLRQWQAPLNNTLDRERITAIDMDEQGGALEPGTYILKLDQVDEDDYSTHVLMVSPVNLTIKAGERDALVWANNLQTGEPVANLPLDFFDDNNDKLGSATTDSDGVARLALNRTDNRSVTAIAREPFALVSNSMNYGVSPWDFGVDYAYDLPEMNAHIYTDRSIYRPDQVVYFKGVIRAEDDVHFSLPPAGRTVNVTIRNSNWEEVYNESLQLNANGTFNGELQLSPTAATGPYNVTVTFDNRSFGHDFLVAAYRPPEFEVNVTPDEEEVVRGTPVEATVDVTYFFGAPVKGAPVDWTVKASNYHFAPDWAARYRFSDTEDPWYCWDCWWMPGETPQPILSGQGTTDENGQLGITLPANLKDRDGEPIVNSTRLTIEATVMGNDNQVISNRNDVIIHSGSVYVGLASQQSFGEANEAQQIDVIALDTDEKPRPNQAVDVEMYRYTWENTWLEDEKRWEWEEQRTLVDEQSVTTDSNGQATVSFTPTEGGSYRVVARTRDSGQREVTSSLFMWIAGDSYISWRRDNNDRITLIASKTTYTAGETAEIMVPSPFQQPHWALITVERGKVLSHEVRKVTGNSLVYQLDITEEHVPNVYVSVVLFNPPVDRGANQSPLPPDYKVGIMPLAVEPDPQTLNITLTPDVEQAGPGEEVTYDIQVTDNEGNPVAAELSLDLVDKAVLTLRPRTTDAIVKAFYSRRPLGIATASGLSLLFDRLKPEDMEPVEEEFDDIDQGLGTGVEEDAAEAMPEPMPTAPAAPEVGDGEGGEAPRDKAAPGTSVREEFADTAYWNATVTTDASGQATVQVKLPDNLTTWVMRGVGLTTDTNVGEGTVDILATKPLLVRPVTPRFLVVGDTAELAANISNRTSTPLDAQVMLQTSGMTVTDQLSQTVRIPANGETKVRWQVTAQDVPFAEVIFRAAAGEYSDASKPRLATGPEGTIPVYRYSAPEVVGTAGQIAEAGSRTEVVMLPPDLDTRNGELTVRVDPSLAASMRDSLKYLEHFEYECTEQTVSRFLPNVVTMQALQRLGIQNPDLEANLPALVEEGLNKLYARQHHDGGWGWWIDDRSNPYVSAYVVFGMVQAKNAGFSVREDVLSRGLDYLRSELTRIDDLATTRGTSRQAWLLYVLAEAGQPDEQRTSEIYEYRDTLSSYARAFLALAMHHTNPNDERIATLLSDLNSSAILSATGAHWEETQYDWWAMNTDTRSTAIILYAMAQLNPENQLNANVVRWLMVARQGEAWTTTQETTWSLLALTRWMEYTGELHPNYDYSIWLTSPRPQELGDAWEDGHIGDEDVMESIVLRRDVADLLRDSGNWLTIGRGEGSGHLYYTAHLRTFLPVEDIEALDRGVIVERRYTSADCTDGPKCPQITQAKVGDVIRVEVSVTAPNNLYYLVVEDPLPAGAEAIDTALATTQQNVPRGDKLTPTFEEPGYWWWWWPWYSRSEFRDEKVVLFADYLHKGSYLYTYEMRATLPGEFHVIPTTANEFYFPEVYGRGNGQLFRITE